MYSRKFGQRGPAGLVLIKINFFSCELEVSKESRVQGSLGHCVCTGLFPATELERKANASGVRTQPESCVKVKEHLNTQDDTRG